MAVLGRKNLPILPQHRREKEKETTEVSIDLNLIQMQTNPNNYSYSLIISENKLQLNYKIHPNNLHLTSIL